MKKGEGGDQLSLFKNELLGKGVPLELAMMEQVSGTLYPEELMQTKQMGTKRMQAFATGRLLARSVLTDFGVQRWPLLADRESCPIWPSGLIGSVTHTGKLCAVAVGSVVAVTSIGIDAEQVPRMHSKLWPSLFTAEEQAYLKTITSAAQQQAWATCFFSAKEAFFKYQFPLTRQWIGFKEAQVEKRGDMLWIRVLKNDSNDLLPWNRFRVSYAFSDQWVLTAILGRGDEDWQ